MARTHGMETTANEPMRCVATLDYAVTALACEDDGPLAGPKTTNFTDFKMTTNDVRPPRAAMDQVQEHAHARAECLSTARSETAAACCASIDFVVEALTPRRDDVWHEDQDGSLVAYDCVEIMAPSETAGVMTMSFTVL